MASNDKFPANLLISNIFCSLNVIKKCKQKSYEMLNFSTNSENGPPVEFQLYANINFIVGGRVTTHFVALGEHNKS